MARPRAEITGPRSRGPAERRRSHRVPPVADQVPTGSCRPAGVVPDLVAEGPAGEPVARTSSAATDTTRAPDLDAARRTESTALPHALADVRDAVPAVEPTSPEVAAGVVVPTYPYPWERDLPAATARHPRRAAEGLDVLEGALQ